MLKHLISGIITCVLAVGVTTLIATSSTYAIGEGGAPAGANAARGDGVPTNLANGDSSIIKKGINLLLYGVGILSVVMLIFGGFRYIVSGGKKESVTAAKNTILYAIIGLLVAIFAFAIINFVIMTAMSGGDTTDI